MSLSILQVRQCIKAVKEDRVASERINSVFSIFKTHSGAARNVAMVIGLTLEQVGAGLNRAFSAGASLGTSEINRWQLHQAGLKAPDEQPMLFDPNLPGGIGYELQCTGIAEAAIAAIAAIQARQKLSPGFIPELKSTWLFSRDTGYAHGAVGIKMSDETTYVLDWWATLDIDNPLVFKSEDFNMSRRDAAREFNEFGGFD